jgi:hypothetical protein
VNEFGGIGDIPREEGRTRHQEDNAKPPLMERTAWSLTRHIAL